MTNELRNILININILKKVLSNVVMSDDDKNEIDFRLNEVISRIDYLIDDELNDIKYKEDKLKFNKMLLEELKKEV